MKRSDIGVVIVVGVAVVSDVFFPTVEYRSFDEGFRGSFSKLKASLVT